MVFVGIKYDFGLVQPLTCYFLSVVAWIKLCDELAESAERIVFAVLS